MTDSTTMISLPAEVAAWLGDTGSVSPALFKRKSGSVLMVGENKIALMQGIAFSRAINATTGRNRRLDSISTSGSGRTQRIANWEILTPILRRLGCTLDVDARKSIVGGDPRVVTRCIIQLHALIGRSDSASDKRRSTAQAKNTSSRKVATTGSGGNTKKKRINRKQAIPVQTIKKSTRSNRQDVEPVLSAIQPSEIARLVSNPDMVLSSATSVPEFWCIVLCEQLHIRPEQASALLTSDSNYLYHCYTNGIKGSFVPIVNMCKAVFQHVDVIVALLAQTKQFSRSAKRGDRNKSFSLLAATFNILRFGLVSNNQIVALWCIRTLTQIVSHFEEMTDAAHLHPYAWKWFIVGSATDRTAGRKATTGLQTLMASLNKHSDLKFPLITLMDAVSNNNLAALFCNHLRSVCPTPLEYLNFVTDMLQPLMEERQTMRGALMKEGVVKYWSDIVKTHAEAGVDKDVRQAAMHLMVELWTQLPEAIEGIAELPNFLLGLLKKGARDSNLSVQITSLTSLFMLLDYFANSNVSYAPYVYKTLIFSLIENHQNEVVRDYIMINMGSALETMTQVPVGVMVEPVVKQVALKGYSTSDFPTFLTLSKHPRLSVRHGLLLADLLGKIALNDPIYGRVATLPLLIVLNRFPNEAAVQEYVERYSKVALSMLMHVETKELMSRRKKLDPTDPKVKNDKENVIIRRTLVLELLGKIIHLGHGSYARKILPLLRALDRQYTTMVGESMPEQEDVDSLDVGATGKQEKDDAPPRRHPGIVALIRFCGETLQGLKNNESSAGTSGGPRGGKGRARRKGRSRGYDSKEPDFESSLMQKSEKRGTNKTSNGNSGRNSGRNTREKPRSAGNDGIQINGASDGFEAFAMEGVELSGLGAIELEEEEIVVPPVEEYESDDHPFDEHEHDSDDEETRALMAKHNLMPGDRMRIEAQRKKRHAEQRRKEALQAARDKRSHHEMIEHVEMDEEAMKKIHDQFHADNFVAAEDQFASSDERRRIQFAKERKARKDRKNNKLRAVGADSLDQDALRKAAARRKKRAARNAAKPWDQPTPKRKDNDADDEEDEDAIIDMTAHSARIISGRKAFKNKKVQRDIDRAAAQKRQLDLRKKYDEERRKLRSRELRSYIRNRYHKRIMKKLEKKAAKRLKDRPFDTTHLPSGAKYLEKTITQQEIIDRANSDFQDQLDYQMEAVEMFRRWHKPMRWLFHMYAHSDGSLKVQEDSFEEQRESGITLGPREWQILCRDFDVVPELGEMAAAGKCFVRGNISVAHEGDSNQCSFEEFNAILRQLIEYLPMLMELPSYNARVACIMGHLRRHACNYDKSEARGDLKNRRMGDMKVWKSDYVDMVTYDYCVPAHLGYSLSLMHCLEIVDEMVLSIFGQHILTFAPNPWSDMEWKPAEKVWTPDVTEIEMTPQLERLYHPKLNARDFDKEPLQMGQAEPGFTSTALRFPRDIQREKLLAQHAAAGIQVHRSSKPLGFGEKCARRFALKSLAAARTAIQVLGDIADDVVAGVAREKLEKLNDGVFDIEETLDLSIYTFVPDLTDPLEVGFISRRKNFADIGATRKVIPPLEPPILKPKETEKRKDRIAREKYLNMMEEKKKDAFKKKRYDLQQKQKALHMKMKKKKDKEAKKKKEKEDEQKARKKRKQQAAIMAKRNRDKEEISQWRKQLALEKKEEDKAARRDKRARMIKNEEIVDRINGQYHWAEVNNEESANDKQQKRAAAAKRKKERKIKERQERHQKLVDKRKGRVEDQTKAAEEQRQLALAESKMSKSDQKERDAAAEKLQAQMRGKSARKEVAMLKGEQPGDQKKKKKKKKKAEPAAEEKVIVLDFEVQLDQPLGMKIDHVEGHNIYPAEITQVVPGGQGDKAGVVVGMYVTHMNGDATNGLVLDDIVMGVVGAKTNQTPLVMRLQLGGVE